ncbi:MAG: dicarboxylate/amino acid:cation symporter [Rudaea sp.]|uniref:dicarboxylate/amino acid:cation symporter n=1 Tax=unclassified Rudaea TaxID=2627037 RepID=UPI0010F8CC7B|nr:MULTISPECIES: dicarboxylate/amino acid:cation symporter [unclassified Rudaea]MBN8885978.1 dicarboxylate/amino acid:cation symporter [Rudaea sp.]MBR0346855.1 dicarboxylate/amino acid:cation symporter [Rudaea sp.]
MKLALHTRVLIGFVVGTAAGALAFWWARHGGDPSWVNWFVDTIAQPAGLLFLKFLKMLVLPLMFSALIVGITEIGDIASLGRVGLRMLIYIVVVTSIAIVVGLLVINLLQPGVGFDPAIRDGLLAAHSADAQAITASKPTLSGVKIILGLVPDNPIKAAADGDFLAVMFFAVMLGIALVLKPTPATAAFKATIQGLLDLVMKLMELIIKLTPYAVAALMFALVASFGTDVLGKLFKYAGCVVLAIAIHMFIVLPLWVRIFGGMSPVKFFKGSEEAILLAFSTASSTGTLPTTLKVAEQNLKLPPQIARFVLTIGASANHHGTALFEGLTVLFIAQCFGLDLSIAQQLTVVGLCIVGSIGTAGVPAGSLPVIAVILGYLHLPPEAIGMILGVDRFLDMCRTSLNVTGDLATAVVVSKDAGDIKVPLPTSSSHG